MKSILPICLLLLAITLPCVAEDFDLGKHGLLKIAVPEGWTASGRSLDIPGEGSMGFDLSFVPKSGANAKCKLTIIFAPEKHAVDKATLDKEVTAITQAFVGGSVEGKVILKDFTLAKGVGAYALFTDASLVGKAPQRGNYKVMGSGEVRLAEDIVGSVSLFTDDADGVDFKAMVKIINSLVLTGKELGI